MQPLEPMPESYANPVSRYFFATRPPFLLASLVAALLGLASARYSGIGLDAVLAMVTLLFAVLAHAGVNVLNDYYDALNGTDARNTERIFPFTGGSRFIQNGVLTLTQTRDFGFALLATVAVAGLWLMAKSGVQLIYIGLAGLFIGWSYSAPPFKLVSRGWGELAVVAGILLVTVGTDFVQRQYFSAAPVIVGLPYALLATNLLYINQFPDRSADNTVGKRHWVARLEPGKASWGYMLVAVTAYVWLFGMVISNVLPSWALLGLLAMPLSIQAASLLLRYAAQPQRLDGAIRLTIAALLMHGVFLSFGLYLD